MKFVDIFIVYILLNSLACAYAFFGKLTTSHRLPQKKDNCIFRRLISPARESVDLPYNYQGAQPVILGFVLHTQQCVLQLSAPTTAPSKKKEKKDIKIEPPVPELFKEQRCFELEFEKFMGEDFYNVLLYNDPFNKRIYVATSLMQVFGWTEDMATEVMLQAHNNGYAVLGEWFKELAEEYSSQLTGKGLLNEVVKSRSRPNSGSGGG